MAPRLRQAGAGVGQVMRTDAIRCDRCGARSLLDHAVKLPAGWGSVNAVRDAPYCNIGTVDLCATCWDAFYATVRTGSWACGDPPKAAP